MHATWFGLFAFFCRFSVAKTEKGLNKHPEAKMCFCTLSECTVLYSTRFLCTNNMIGWIGMFSTELFMAGDMQSSSLRVKAGGEGERDLSSQLLKEV